MNTNLKESYLNMSIPLMHRTSIAWIEELKFMEGEIRFFQGILDKYFYPMTRVERIEQTQAYFSKLSDFKMHQFARVQASVFQHEKELLELMKDSGEADELSYRITHQNITEGIKLLEINFKDLKREIFIFTETIIHEEKTSHLLGLL